MVINIFDCFVLITVWISICIIRIQFIFLLQAKNQKIGSIMKTFKKHRDYGFWDQDIRLRKLSKLGDPNELDGFLIDSMYCSKMTSKK